MYQITGSCVDAEQLLAEAISCETVAKHLRRLAGGAFPTDEELASAPIFNRFMFIAAPVTICMGAMTDSGDGVESLSYSDELLCDGSADGWVLSRSRLYRVGRLVTNPNKLPNSR